MLATQPYKKEDTEDAIVINEEVKYPEVCSKTKGWMHIGKYTLTLAEVLINGQWLNDLHVNLVKNKFSLIGGLQNTVLFQSTHIHAIV